MTPRTTPATSETSFRELPLDELHESSTNPRRRFTALDELAASISQVGILEPLLVRPVNGHHEIVAGARRYRAAQLAGLTAVPCVVRPLDDRAALEVSIIENLQRSDVHPLDEADGYAALMKADGAYTVDAIAAKVGKSVSYVRNRLKLGTLVPEVRKAFDADEITAAHALAIARLNTVRQPEALKHCFYDLYRAEEHRSLVPLRDLEEWITRSVPVDPLAPETQELFPELAAAATHAAASGAELLALASLRYMDDRELKKLQPRPLLGGLWKEAKGKKATCPHVRTGVIVLGDGRGSILQVCTERSCTKHWESWERPQPTSTRGDNTDGASEVSKYEVQRRAKEAKERKAAAAFNKVKTEACGALLKKFDGQPLTDDVVRWLVEQLRPQALYATLESAIGPKKTWTAARGVPLLLFCHAIKGCYATGQLAARMKTLGINVEKLAAAGGTKPAKKSKTAKTRKAR